MNPSNVPARKTPNLFNETFVTLVVRVFVLALALAVSAVTARALGTTANGSYNLIILLLTTTALFASFGIQMANVFYGARSPDELPTLLGNSIVAALVFGAVGVGVFIVLSFLPPVIDYLTENNVDVGWVRGLILVVPLLHINLYVPEILRGAGRVRTYILVSFWRQVVIFLALIGFILFLGSSIGSVVAAFIVAQVILAALNLTLALRVTGGKVNFSGGGLRRNVKFGLPFHVGTVAQFLNYRLDVFLVGVFLTPAEVGYYALATLLAERLWEIPSAIQQILLYRVASESDNAWGITVRSNRIVAACMLLLCLLVALVSYPLIRLAYGEDYIPVVSAFVLLIPGVWALSMGKILAAHIAGIGRTGVGSVAVLASLVATVALDLLLIPRLGINGASLASSVSYTVFTVILLWFFTRHAEVRLIEMVLINRQDMALLRKSFSNLFRKFMPARR